MGREGTCPISSKWAFRSYGATTRKALCLIPPNQMVMRDGFNSRASKGVERAEAALSLLWR